MAGKKGRSGGKRKGAGRKTKAEELGLPNLINEVIGEEGKRELIDVLYRKSKTGSYQHLQLLLAYIFGKPVETVDLKAEIDQSIDISKLDESTIKRIIKALDS